MFLSEVIAEDRIRKALEQGQFENLEGMGKPLPHDEAAHLPPEIRLAYRMLKTSGYIDDPKALEKEIVRVQDLLEHLEDESERYRQMQKLEVLTMRMERVTGRPVRLDDDYYDRVVHRVRVSEK
ncbi:DUF1992 domain-containing protein [Salidesulfovibrio brasiliensis]